MQEKEHIITLKAVYGKQQGPLLLSPCKDRITGQLKGVKQLSEEEMRKEARPVTADTQRRVSDGLQLNIKLAVDKTDWDWMKECGEIADSFEAAQISPKALYYIDRPDKEVEDRLKRKDKRFEAESIIRNASQIQREEICRLLGQNVSYMQSHEVLDTLLSKLDQKGGVDSIIGIKNDPKYKTKLFLYRCIDLKKITKRSNGMLVYGEMTIGLTIEAAVQWLDDANNRDIVAKLFADINSAPVKEVGSFIDELELEASLKGDVDKIVGSGSKPGEGSVESKEVANQEVV